MHVNLERAMIKLSNNSQLTGTATVKLEKALESLSTEDKNTVLEWFSHACRQQDQKVFNAERSNRYT